MRAPSQFDGKSPTDPLTAALEQEIAAETVSTYVRLAKKLERALEAHRQCDPHEADRRAVLRDAAARALWHLVIQRDIMRLPGTERYLRELDVPREVRSRMGIVT